MQTLTHSPLKTSHSLLWLTAPAQHYLRVSLAISLLLHAGVLAWHFGAAAARPTPPSSLEVVLLNARSDTAPDTRQAQAQFQMNGGGNALSGIATSPLPQVGPSAETIVLAAMRKRQLQLEAEQTRLMTQLQAPNKVNAVRQAPDTQSDATAPGKEQENQDAVLQNAQIAALAAHVQHYNAAPRRTFIAPSAQASVYAAYLDAWRTRIETIGTQHYPDGARGHIYGSLRLTVSIRADGSVANIDIDQPSSHAVLNQAARRIVQLAAPFPPFPPDIARTTDILVITRSWHFVNDTLSTLSP